MRSKKKSLKQEVKTLRTSNKELLSILDHKIFSSKTYKMWQFYNKIKRLVIYVCKPIILAALLLFVIPVYVLYVFLLYCASACLAALLPAYKPLQLKKSQSNLDGVSFVIPTWNKESMLIQCIKRLDAIASQEANGVKKEIIVIDNGSKDKTVESLHKLITKIPLKVIPLPKNYGFAYAINRAAAESDFNYLYLLNNDMFVKPNFLDHLVEFVKQLHEKNQRFYGIASQIFFFKKAPRRVESGKTYYMPLAGNLYVAHCIMNDSLASPSITGYVGGGSSLIQKHVFQYLHGYDHLLLKPMYVEDVDTSFRAWRMGFPSYFLPQSAAIHHHQSSAKKLRRTPEYYIKKNLVFFMLKNISSLSEMLKHGLFFPMNAFIENSVLGIIFETFVSSPQLFFARVDALRYSYKHSYDRIIDFPHYEKEYVYS